MILNAASHLEKHGIIALASFKELEFSSLITVINFHNISEISLIEKLKSNLNKSYFMPKKHCYSEFQMQNGKKVNTEN